MFKIGSPDKSGSASGGDTKNMGAKKCYALAMSHKKFLVVGLLLIAFLLLVVAGFSKVLKERSGLSQNYSKKMVKSLPTAMMNQSSFFPPQDAFVKGEIAITVDNLDTARKNIADIASKESGNIYSTDIAYASGSVRNGSIVVSVPKENFNATFSALKNSGTRLVQESTQQIQKNTALPYPTAVSEPAPATSAPADSGGSTATTSGSADQASQSATIVTPVYPQVVQDRGYVKVVFAEFPNVVTAGTKVGGSMMGIAGYEGLGLKNNLWLVIGLKILALIVLIALLIVIFRRISRSMKETERRKGHSHVVKQLSKTRSKVVRVSKKRRV